MNGWKRIFGLDVVNSVLVAAGAFATVIFVGELTNSGEMAMGAMVLCIGGYGILRHYGLKSLPPEDETSGSWRVGELEARVAELEAMNDRMAELEERLDFTERLLAKSAGPSKIEGAK